MLYPTHYLKLELSNRPLNAIGTLLKGGLKFLQHQLINWQLMCKSPLHQNCTQ